MPFPLAVAGLFSLGFWTGLRTVIIRSLTHVFGKQWLWILAAMGLTLTFYGGFQAFLGYIVSDINTILGSIGNNAVSAQNQGWVSAYAVRFAANCGLFDALNIVISGYMTAASFIGTKFALSKLQN